ncbi:MAG: hypothetical protein KDA83_05180 [Planctomycetales bacterium]|nr:hypothetical protein [Planctomycetales bacterium]
MSDAVNKTDAIDEVALDSDALRALPEGSGVGRFVFRALKSGAETADAAISLSRGLGRQAVRLTGDAAPTAQDSEVFRVLTVPFTDANESLSGQWAPFDQAQQWVAAAAKPDELPVNIMSFHGAHIAWTRRRMAIVSSPEKFASLTATLLEYAYCESELLAVEDTLADSWEQMERDLPVAFEFKDRDLATKRQLAERFQRVMLLGARLAKIGPYAHSPHHHPPTLASQVAERLRERGRMAHRHEAIGDQLEVFEGVYELCGHRASEFTLARGGNTLEWIIIIMLLAQIILTVFDMLTATGT